jgi:Secretion system C-terminal sorting domain
MKNIFLFAFLSLAYFLPASATHLMGGDVKIKYDTATQQYKMYLTHYRDNSGNTAPASQQLIAYMVETDMITGLSQISQSSGIYLTPDLPLGWQVTMANIPYNVEVYNYSGIIPFPMSSLQAGRYKFLVYDCCRNGAIQNLTNPLSESITLSADVIVSTSGVQVNNTAEFLAEPIIYGPINQLWNYNPFPFDADGDSLSWSIVTPLGSYPFPSPIPVCLGYVNPASSTANPFALNNVTGELSWEPTQIGNFVASFSIDEYRNGALISTVNRDMQYIVLSDSLFDSLGNYYFVNKLPSFTQATVYQNDPINKINYMYYTPGQQFQFEILGDDFNINQFLRMTGISNLLKLDINPATFTTAATGVGNQIKGIFTWTPGASYEREEKVVFRINDGYYNNDFTLVLRKSNIPANIGTNIATGQHIEIAPNPIKNNTLNIQFDNSTNAANASFVVTDFTGKQIETRAKIVLGQTVQIQLPPVEGIYFIQIKTSSEIVSKKFVIQH